MTILDRIVASVRSQLSTRKRLIPERDLMDQIGQRSPARSMTKALRQDMVAVIAEIKRASPSKGVLRAELDPAGVVGAYSQGGAAAVSVLTEDEHFGGSLKDLRVARSGTRLPLLRKDFIVDRYQLVEARASGADAVLLIAAVLEAPQLKDLMHEAASLGLEALVEVYEAHEMDRIDWDITTMVGVNNRNLHTFTVDPDHSVRLLRCAPAGVVKIAESGLSTPVHLARAYRAGVDAFLIGESFMRARDPGRAVHSLLRATRQILATYAR